MKPDWSILEEEMRQVEWLQQAVIDHIADKDLQNTDDVNDILEYYHLMYALMEKQGVLYTRLLLMKDPKLVGLVSAIEEVCDKLGKPDEMDYQEYHLNMQDDIKVALSSMTGEDMDDYDGIDVDFRWG